MNVFGNCQIPSPLFSSFCCQVSLINGNLCSVTEEKKWWIPNISQFAAQIVIGKSAVSSLHFPRWAYKLIAETQGKRLRLVKNAHPVSKQYTNTHNMSRYHRLSTRNEKLFISAPLSLQVGLLWKTQLLTMMVRIQDLSWHPHLSINYTYKIQNTSNYRILILFI